MTAGAPRPPLRLPRALPGRAACGWAWAACLALLTACSGAGPQADGPLPDGAPHRTGHGFRNNDIAQVDKPLADLLRWQWQRWRAGVPTPPQTPTPAVAPDLPFLARNATAGAAMEPTVTWIGHASALVQAGGLNVLTDPVFSERASPVQFAGPKRALPPGLTPATLPHVDVVLVSHNHYDHLDRASIKALARQPGGPPRFLVPLGLKAWMADLGIAQVDELDWWESRRVAGVDFHLTPVQHWSARGIGDRNATLWGGWAVFAPDFHWYFSGDTGYSRDFVRTRAHFAARQTAADGGGFDLALIAIGAYAPRWFMQPQHVDPTEAVQVHRDLGAKHSIGIHWGTFQLTDEPLDQPPRDRAAAAARQGLAPQAFTVLAVGQTERLARRAAASAPIAR